MQVKLHAERYEQLIDRRGRVVDWQEAEICSCWNTDSGQPSYSCTACNGKGYVYQPAIEVTAVVMSITLNKDFQEMAGMFEVGDAVMIVPKRVPTKLPNGIYDMKDFKDNPMYEIGLWDKIHLLDDEYKSSEVLIKDTPIGNRPADTLVNELVTRVKALRKYDQVAGTVTTYLEGTDFKLIANLISWLVGGNSPASGEQYSVVYFHKPTYVVTAALPKPRHQDGQDLPRYVVLRYLAGGVERV